MSSSDLLEYKLIDLKSQASEIDNLKRDIDTLETYLNECLGKKEVSASCDLGCLLELKGITLIKKQTKFDYLQAANNLQKENEVLKKKLICSQNVTETRNQAQKTFDTMIDKIKALFTKDNEEEMDKQVEPLENLTNLFNQIYNVILDKADINRQMREKDAEIDSLLNQIQQHCAILSCIKRKKDTNEKLFQADELEETYDTWTLKNNELQEQVNHLTKVYNDVVLKTNGLRALDDNAINALVRQIQPDPEKFERYYTVFRTVREPSVLSSKLSAISDASADLEHEKEHLNRLKNCVIYLSKQESKLNAMVRREKNNREMQIKGIHIHKT